MTENRHIRIHDVTAILGLIAAVPVILFVTLNILKFEIGVLSGIVIPTVHPAVLLGGGMTAVLLNTWSILDFRVSRQYQNLSLSFTLCKRPRNIAVLKLAALFLFILVSYVVIENVANALGP